MCGSGAHGSRSVSDLVPLPRQPEGLSWPTKSWPEAELVPGVDRFALEELLDYALAQPAEMGQTHATLIVHRGRIVAERYADEMDETTPHASWSMA